MNSSSLFSPRRTWLNDLFSHQAVCQLLTRYTSQLKGVQKLLTGLKSHKAPGPDKIPTRLLKLASAELSPGLANPFQLSLDQGQIPLDWKTTLVAPVFRKGNRSPPSNYRPIPLRSVSCKVFEHIISSNIMSRSCDNQLLLSTNGLAKGIDNSKQIDAVLLDFSKAFDKVPHTRLLQKLDHFRIRGTTHSWIEDFLTSCK